jgi:hypothetical protein
MQKMFGKHVRGGDDRESLTYRLGHVQGCMEST